MEISESYYHLAAVSSNIKGILYEYYMSLPYFQSVLLHIVNVFLVKIRLVPYLK